MSRPSSIRSPTQPRCCRSWPSFSTWLAWICRLQRLRRGCHQNGARQAPSPGSNCELSTLFRLLALGWTFVACCGVCGVCLLLPC